MSEEEWQIPNEHSFIHNNATTLDISTTEINFAEEYSESTNKTESENDINK